MYRASGEVSLTVKVVFALFQTGRPFELASFFLCEGGDKSSEKQAADDWLLSAHTKSWIQTPAYQVLTHHKGI